MIKLYIKIISLIFLPIKYEKKSFLVTPHLKVDLTLYNFHFFIKDINFSGTCSTTILFDFTIYAFFLHLLYWSRKYFSSSFTLSCRYKRDDLLLLILCDINTPMPCLLLPEYCCWHWNSSI